MDRSGRVAEPAECCAPLAGGPIGADQAERLVGVFRALADPVRLRLVNLIASHPGGEACVCELTPAFGLSQPTISHHLKVLREAGLVQAERRATWMYYRLVPGAIEAVGAVFAGHCTSGAAPAGDPVTR